MSPRFVIPAPPLTALRRFVLREDLRQRELEKAFNVTARLTEAMATPQVFDRFPGLEGKLRKGLRAECVLMMVDLSPFSEVAKHLSPSDIALFLEGYYRLVVRRVEAVGGVVEKYIGDAVLAVFGEPFDTRPGADVALAAIDVSQDIILDVLAEMEGEVVAKVALSSGPCFIGYVGPPTHSELTIVGNPLTALFRLEEHCPRNAVIAPSGLFVPQWRAEKLSHDYSSKVPWIFSEGTVDLRDVASGFALGVLEWRGDDD